MIGLLRMLCLSAIVVLLLAVSVALPSAGIELSATTIRQGDAVEVTVYRSEVGDDPVLRFGGRTWRLYRTGGDVLQTYLGTDPFTKPGTHRVIVESRARRGVVFSRSITITREAFPTRRLTFDPDKIALLDPKLVAIERKKVGAALAFLAAEKFWERPFAIPVEGRRTSPYGVLSVYQGRLRGWHRGTDFAAPVGTPVHAANHGIIRLAEPLPVSGNAVFIDHGMSIVTSYLHLSAVHVRAGQRVRKGDLIGAVGSTGLATGPHLHWGLRTNGVLVDPLPWTE